MSNAKPAREDVLNIDGRKICLRSHHHRKARHMILRIDAKADCVLLTLPRSVSYTSGIKFAREKSDWFIRRLDSLPPLTPFADESLIPFQGEKLCIRYFPLAGAAPIFDQNILYVPGPEHKMADSVRGWLRHAAQQLMATLSASKAEKIGRPPPPIRLNDPRSRWGSCSETGRINFSWRLIMAPKIVLEYVVAHEVAHLEELNHGKQFEKIVRSLTENVDEARDWLTEEGTGLLRYG